MRWIVLLLLCSLSQAEYVFVSNDGYDFEQATISTTVYAEFHDCINCQHFYTANFNADDDIFVQVGVPAQQTDTIQIIPIFGPDAVVSKSTVYEIDSFLFSVAKIRHQIDTTASTNTSVILQVTSNSPHAHYVVTCGKSSSFNFLDWTVLLPYVTQRARMWSSTFVWPFFFFIIAFLYFITWPLQRYKSYVIMPKLAIISFGSCICYTFYQYFYVVQYNSNFSILTFLLHIVPNLVYIILLMIIYETTVQKEAVLIILAIVSLLVGGGGNYVGSLFLILGFVGLLLMKNKSQDKDKKLLFCKV